MSEPLLSVVVIGRNEEPFVGGCLAAVLRAVAPFEADIVFVDSRSTDRTLDIARTYPVRIVVLSAAASLCPALGRLVGEKLTTSKYVLFVDGDTDVEGQWVQEGLRFLEAHPEVAGVSGRLREIYYAHGRIVGEHPDIFAVASGPQDVDELGGNAIYRRAALDAVGSFNPFLSSYEEMDLAERLRQSGFRIVRLPITLGTHRTGQRGTVRELRRRYRDNLIRGYGQVLRRSLGTPMLWSHARLMNGRHLQFQGVLLVGLLAAVMSLATCDQRWIGAWCAFCALVTVGFMVKGRSLSKPFLLYVEWAVWSVPMIRGFLERPRDPRTLVIESVIERVEDWSKGRAVAGLVPATSRASAQEGSAPTKAGAELLARGGRGESPILRHAGYLATHTFGSLDGLRAVAILAVVWHHAHGWHRQLWESPAVGALPEWAIAGRGLLGVDLFFVISGFLIVTLLLRERRRRGTISLRSFYARRALRIFPAYYLLLVVLGGVAYLAPMASSAAVRRELPYAVFYLSNLVPMVSPLGITWSLAAEEQFYLVVPTLEKYCGRTMVVMLPALYVLASLPAFGFLSQVTLPEFFRRTTFGPILLGVMLAHVLDHPEGFRWTARVVGHWVSPIAATALVLVACAAPWNLDGLTRMLIHWGMLALVASCVISEDHALARLFAAWPIKRIGVVSYGIYLFHMFGLYAAYRALRPMGYCPVGVFFIAALVTSWGVAEASYRMFEIRFLALKDRVGRQWMVDSCKEYPISPRAEA